MPIAYRIDPAENVLALTLTGPVTATDFENYFSRTVDDPGYGPSLNVLILASGATSFPTFDEVSAIGATIHRRNEKSPTRVAVVATTPLSIGMTSMFHAMTRLGNRYQLFEDETTARAWLQAA